jgi:hypothetical protein
MLLRLSGRVSRLFRAGRSLNAKEKAIHDKGLVSTLKQTHDDLDPAVSSRPCPRRAPPSGSRSATR